MRWSFATRLAAEAAQAQIAAALPPDVDWQGQRAPKQVTNRWADVAVTSDGQFTLPAHPKLPMPATAKAMTEAQFALVAPVLTVHGAAAQG